MGWCLFSHPHTLQWCTSYYQLSLSFHFSPPPPTFLCPHHCTSPISRQGAQRNPSEIVVYSRRENLQWQPLFPLGLAWCKNHIFWRKIKGEQMEKDAENSIFERTRGQGRPSWWKRQGPHGAPPVNLIGSLECCRTLGPHGFPALYLFSNTSIFQLNPPPWLFLCFT